MSVVIINKKPTSEDIKKSLEDYPSYIKITIDVKQVIIAMGGEYHADAEEILIQKYNSKQKDIWGGGYDLKSKQFETNAMINMRPFHENSSMEILDPIIRKKFLQIVKGALGGIESLL